MGIRKRVALQTWGQGYCEYVSQRGGEVTFFRRCIR